MLLFRYVCNGGKVTGKHMERAEREVSSDIRGDYNTPRVTSSMLHTGIALV